MKQADLLVGNEYAFQTYKSYNAAPLAARVRIVSVDGRGKATVRVVDPGKKPPKNAWGARPVKRNEQVQVATRDIVCPWDEWADRAASIDADLAARAAKQREWWDDIERQQADRLVVNPERALPEEYDEEHVYAETDADERAALGKEYIKARGLGIYATPDKLTPLLVDLPVLVLRDILATNPHRRIGSADTVAATFMRSAELLEQARVAAMDRHGHASGDIPQPDRLLGEADIAFVDAIHENIAVSGGELLLPPVPALPDWVDEHERSMAPSFGWLRLAVGDTSGERLHSPGCRSVRSRHVLEADHMPWWLLMLEKPQRLCGRCDGPGVRDLVPMAGFVAAVDVWHARGRDRIERWQQATFQRLLSTAAAARTQMLEPDITLTWRIVAALTDNAPGENGWAAYAAVAATRWNRFDEELGKLTPPELEAARVVARDRLTTLAEALPSSQRPLPLPQAADLNVLRQRYTHLKKLLQDTVPQLDRLLFTLPGAI
ncbi:hypothetical protein LWC34_45345 [Kibdelosporangium philippinense]|uniref:Uncharacterized protein n=1 Tax=Kibdelosporangium philippinense TaxID=211113 RepID=A0ABS8ZTQ1_9PSEU|nr:hypothetical protein [Kibdelosporangium philippinense]MCE7009986.1 hypothetical protein [Kibdelosporangium philippinense]